MDALGKAIEIVGSGAELARALGVVPMAVTQWKRRGVVPPRHCPQIETATHGAVTRYDLRPDIFGAVDNATSPASPHSNQPQAGAA